MKLQPGDQPLARWLGVGALAALVAGLVLLRLRPELAGSLDARCALREVTGLPCPTCGTTRAATRLAAGDVAGAVAASPLAVLAIAAVGTWGAAALAASLRPVWRRRLVVPPQERARLWWALAALVAAGWLWVALHGA